MRLKIVIAGLLLLQFALFVHMTLLLTGDSMTSQVIAQGGRVDAVNLVPEIDAAWGGAVGALSQGGVTQLNIEGNEVVTANVYVANASCRKTELFAANTSINGSDVVPITPAAADALLGLDPTSSISVSAMFTVQQTYDLYDSLVTLYSLSTNGQLRAFPQGVGAVGSTVVFVGQTLQNGLSYNGTYANYQLLLPEGLYDVSYDDSDTCFDFPDTEDQITEIERDLIYALRIIGPDRFCAGTTQEFVAVESLERVICRAADETDVTCNPVEAEITIQERGGDVVVRNTYTDGRVEFTPRADTVYTITARTEDKVARRVFMARDCQEFTQRTGESVIQFDRNQIPLYDEDPRDEIPEDALALAQAEYFWIAWLTVIIIILALIAYYEKHKDDSLPLLQARLWITQKLRKN